MDLESLYKACDGVDAVLHMAGITRARSSDRYQEVNLGGTRNLIAASEKMGIKRLVYFSTRAIGSEGGGYSFSKELAEREIKASKVKWVILRLSEVYGTGNDPITKIDKWLKNWPFVPIIGDGSYRLNPVHVNDVVIATIRALSVQGIEGRTYTIAGPEEMTYLDLIASIEAVRGLPRRTRIKVPLSLAIIFIAILSYLRVGETVPDQIPRLLLPKAGDISPAAHDLDFTPGRLTDRLIA